MEKLQIDLKNDDNLVSHFKETLGSDAMLVKADQFEGDVNIVSIVVTLSTAAVSFIGGVVKERIAANRYIKVKYKGVEVQGENLKKHR
jgi:hypothetical protein